MLVTMLLIIFQPISANAQVKPKKMETGKEYHLRLQKQNSWQNYQATYKKAMLENAKEARKQRKAKEKAEKDRQRFFARIERIKGN